jgi:phosphate transport system permease protein
MTGIIAQEMGEVPVGSIHRHALFVVAIVLFFLSLGLNYVAQKIVHRYRVSIG